MSEYNTDLEPLLLREVGRNVQKLADFVVAVEDKEKRTRYAEGLVELMKQVIPMYKDTPEYTRILWDDLHILTKFKLDVDSPFPAPEPSVLYKKPERVDYNKNRIQFRHYGKNILLLIEQAKVMEDEQAKENAIVYIGRLMKSFHATWNKEIVVDDVIINNIKILSNDTLSIDSQKVNENKLFDPLYKEKVNVNTASGGNRSRKNTGSGSNRSNANKPVKNRQGNNNPNKRKRIK